MASDDQNTLACTGQGAGPPLVILHGLFGNRDNFAGIARLLAERWRVIRLDLPGHGQSATQARLDYPVMAQRVQATLQSLELGPCHLLGHSMGGKVAMTLAGQPQAPALHSLIVVDIAPRRYPPHHDDILAALSSLDPSAVVDRKAADRALAARIDDPGVRAFLLKSLVRDPATGWRWQFDLQGLVRDYEHLADAPLIAALIRCPTLFIKGGDSDYLSDGDEALVREHFTEPSLRSIAGAGHWPHAEKPALFARLVDQFMARHSPSGPG